MPSTSDKTIAGVFAGVVAVSAVALGFAVYADEMPAIFAPSLLLFEAVCVLFFLLFLQEVAGDTHIGVESRWGGLGRGATGWHISRSLVYLVCALLFGAGFAVTSSRLIDSHTESERVRLSATAVQSTATSTRSAATAGRTPNPPPPSPRTPSERAEPDEQ